MRLAVFSDVHGNLEALEAFFHHVREIGVDEFACLGDIIGYGPNPNECLEKVRSLPEIGVTLGNHEWASLNLEESSAGMSPMVYDSIVWTEKHLNSVSRKYIAGLQCKIERGIYTFVHASAFQPKKWEYLTSVKKIEIMHCCRSSSTRITFVGHTHRPMILDSRGNPLLNDETFPNGTVYSDDGTQRLLVNPGSIGQPRDTLRKPCYVIHDTVSNEFIWYRLNNYDPKITAKRILATDLPKECASYLYKRSILGMA